MSFDISSDNAALPHPDFASHTILHSKGHDRPIFYIRPPRDPELNESFEAINGTSHNAVSVIHAQYEY
jgi:hypothetical protein